MKIQEVMAPYKQWKNGWAQSEPEYRLSYQLIPETEEEEKTLLKMGGNLSCSAYRPEVKGRKGLELTYKPGVRFTNLPVRTVNQNAAVERRVQEECREHDRAFSRRATGFGP